MLTILMIMAAHIFGIELSVANISFCNCSTFTGWMQWSNTQADGYLGLLISLAFFAIILMGLVMMGNDLEIALLAASFFCIFLSVGLIGMGVFPAAALVVYVGGAALGFIMSNSKGISKPYGS